MLVEIQIINKGHHTLPKYETINSAGVDIYANLDCDVELKSLERVLIPTGLFLAIPIGYEAQIRPRSGNAYKFGLTVLNSPGTIDSDYRGEIKVLLVNLSSENVVVKDGDRIAQMVFAQHEVVNFIQVDVLSDTLRGEGGFGHTGLTI